MAGQSRQDKQPQWPKGIGTKRGRFRIQVQVLGNREEILTDLEADDRNLAEALRRRDELRQRLERGLAKPTDVTLDEAAESFLAWAKEERKRKTWNGYNGQLASLRFWFEGKKLESITAGDVEDYKAWRRSKGIKAGTIRTNLHTLSQLYQYSMKHGWVESNIVRSVEIPSSKDSRRDFILSAQQEKIYLRAASKVSSTLHDVAVIMLHQGLRPDAEVLQLRAAHINLRTGRLYVARSKSRASERKMLMSRDVLAIVKSRLSNDWLFPSAKFPNRPVAYATLAEHHGRACKSTNLPTLDLYNLRHTFATRFYNSTKDPFALAEVLGHADLSTIRRYVHDTEERIDSTIRKFHGL